MLLKHSKYMVNYKVFSIHSIFYNLFLYAKYCFSFDFAVKYDLDILYSLFELTPKPCHHKKSILQLFDYVITCITLSK